MVNRKLPLRKIMGTILVVVGLISFSTQAGLLPASLAPIPDINIRVHVTDNLGAPITTASTTILEKLRYTNIYGDVDFPVPKSTKNVVIEVSKTGYLTRRDSYDIPEKLINDDYRINVRLYPVSSPTKVTPTATTNSTVATTPVVEQYQKTQSNNYMLSFTFILIGLMITFYPDQTKQKRRK